VKIKLDENLPASAAEPLRTRGHDVDTVIDEGLAGAEDTAVLTAATGVARLLMTLDRGLGDVRSYPPGTHCGVVVVRVDSQSPRAVVQAVSQLCATVDLDDLVGCTSVWRAGALRVRRARNDLLGPSEGEASAGEGRTAGQ
jgi:predicted nuclease of predicted toxin-antitoxin system